MPETAEFGRSPGPGVPSFEARLTRYFDAALAHMDARERAAEFAAEEEPLPSRRGANVDSYRDSDDGAPQPSRSPLAAAALCSRLRAMGARCTVYPR
jgi:hypothetical protein